MFTIGNLVQTAGIAHECKNDSEFLHNVRKCLTRYMKKDWGDLCEDDRQANENALVDNDRIFACYNVPTKTGPKKVYIITEHDRSVTTILFADEY